jgi:hypothetical protein
MNGDKSSLAASEGVLNIYGTHISGKKGTVCKPANLVSVTQDMHPSLNEYSFYSNVYVDKERASRCKISLSFLPHYLSHKTHYNNMVIS